MITKNNAVLQDPEAMFRARIADPKVAAEIEQRDSTRPAAEAVMACFLGLGGKIESLEFAPKSEWRYGFLAGGCRSYSSVDELEPMNACLKRGDITNARKHAARQIMYHMAAESARNRIESEPDEDWMQGEAEVWFEWASLKPDSLTDNWAGLDPATFASRTGAALWTANRVYPLPDYVEQCNNEESYALYIEVCRWADEFFADKRILKAVQTLAKELVRREFINGDEMLDIIDGKDQTLAYLEEIASSKKWRNRIQPTVSPAFASKHSRKSKEANRG